MSSLKINGISIFSCTDNSSSHQRTAVSTAPSWDTHRLVDGSWVPKGQAAPASITPPRTIGFTLAPVVTPSVLPTGTSFLSSRKEYLRAIEVAAGHTLLAGKNQSAIDAIRRGRLGGRKDNMGELHSLLQEYNS